MSSTIRKIDRYHIVRLLGTGGMGDVYQAQDPNVDRPVAIKVLKEAYNTEEFRNRFLREARAAAKLAEHPNVVKIFDAAKFRGRPFIAMEYIAGSSLAQIIAAGEPLALARKLDILDELCAGLAWAHAAGVTHRDIKPGNIMLDGRGHVKIVDFGIAKSDTWETSQQVSMGTPCYMSPEQLRQQPIDHRTDIFSVGVVAYELLTYRKLFEGDAMQQVARVLSGHIPPMSGPFGPIPLGLDRVVRRALATQPDDRFKDMAAMQRAIASTRSEIQQPGLMTFSAGVAASGSADTLLVAGFNVEDNPVPKNSRDWFKRGGIATVALVSLTIGAWLIFTGPAAEPTQPPPSHPQAAAPTQMSRPGANTARDGRDRSSSTRRAGTRSPVTNGTENKEQAVPNATVTEPAEATEPPRASEEPRSDTVAPPSVITPEFPTLPPSSGVLTAVDEKAIHSTLGRLESAFESLFAANVKKIWPSMPHADLVGLEAKFVNARSYRLQISNVQIKPGTISRVDVACITTHDITPLQGAPRKVRQPARITLEKIDGQWVIDEFSER